MFGFAAQETLVVGTTVALRTAGPRLRWGLLFAALLGLVGCRSDIQQGLESARDLLYQKQYVEAERLYRKLVKRLDDRGRLAPIEEAQRLQALARLGEINALYLHNYPQAIADYHAVVRHAPGSDSAYASRTTVADIYHHKLGQLERAVDEYQKLLSAFPGRTDNRAVRLKMVGAYFELRNYDQARAEAETLVAQWPDSIEAQRARFYVANSLYVEGRYSEAVVTYQRMLEEAVTLHEAAVTMFELGQCYQELGEPEQALGYYYASLSDHPNPSLVQRKIRRVRGRLHRTRPMHVVKVPAELQERLAALREKRLAGPPQVGQQR